MSVFEDLKAELGLPLEYEQHGQTISYTPAGGSPGQLTAIVGPDQVEEETRAGQKLVVRGRIVKVLRDASLGYGAVADPSLEDLATIGGVQYSVVEIQHQTASEIVLKMKRVVEGDRERPGLRRPDF